MSMKSKEEVVQEYRIQSLQEATMRVIARKGMAGATMQDIADEAGVAKGTIYLYFRDRDELVEKTFESAMAQLSDKIDSTLDQPGPFEQVLRAIIAAQMAFFSANREFFRLYMTMRSAEGDERQRRHKQVCHPKFQARVQKLASILSAAMDRGEIARTDPNKTATFIVEGGTAVLIECLTGDSPQPEADVELITGLIFDGIRKRS